MGIDHIGVPTINGIAVPLESEILQRHVSLHGGGNIYATSTGTSTFDTFGIGSGTGGGELFLWSGTGQYAEWDIGLLMPGSWALYVLVWQGYAEGIARFSIDGVALGADYDAYAASYPATYPMVYRTFTVASGARTRRLRVTCMGKNASATNPYLRISHMHLDRTGA